MNLKQLFTFRTLLILRSLSIAAVAAIVAMIATGTGKGSHLMTIYRSILMEPLRERIPATVLAVLLSLLAISEFQLALSRPKSKQSSSLDRAR